MSQLAAYVATMVAVVGDRFTDRKDRGATAVEYGLLVGLIAVVIIAVVVTLGEQLAALFQGVSDELPGVGTGEGA
ncbi:Flp family type IVb pilin [Pseudactinotalea sp. Z1739]|uniref:Flp family type IVb pilin n=1 Tax=Pseudactinotalea sp. Z1739 TaxID=3413028 RepID=UPI003C7A9D4D